MSIHVTDFKWEKGKNDLRYIELLEKTLKNEQAITAKAVAKIRELSKENKEIRNKTIDEFAEKICTELTERSFEAMDELEFVMNVVSHDKMQEVVMEVAEQLKGGAE